MYFHCDICENRTQRGGLLRSLALRVTLEDPFFGEPTTRLADALTRSAAFVLAAFCVPQVAVCVLTLEESCVEGYS